MKKEYIKQLIRDFHLASLPVLKQRAIEIPIETGKIITLVGVRRSGKTSCLFNIIEKLQTKCIPQNEILYINFEDERFDLKVEELDLLLQAYQELYPYSDLTKCWLFFDEIQNINNWDTFIRRIYDSGVKNIFITGSNARFLSSEIATSLRGRTVSYEIFPLSFSEYLYFKQIDIDLYSSKSIALINHHLSDYLVNGGFPEVINYDDRFRNRVLQEYFNVMIYRDLLERYDLKNIPALKFFMKRLIASSTKQISVNNIYNELKSSGFKIGKNQLYDILDACQNIHLAIILKKHTKSLVKRELGEKKVYCVDNGLLNAMDFKFSEDRGKTIEQTVLIELKRREKDVYFFKDKTECDFIIKKGFDITEAIQVSATIDDGKTRKREIRGLIDCCRTFGLTEGLIITVDGNEEFEIEGITVKIRPLYRWLLMENINVDHDCQ